MTRLAGILHIVRITTRKQMRTIDFLVDICFEVYPQQRFDSLGGANKLHPDLVVFMQGLVKRDRLIIGFADDLSCLTVSNKEHV